MVPSTVQTLPFDPYNSSVDLIGINALILSRRGLRCGEANHVAKGIKSYFFKSAFTWTHIFQIQTQT